MTIVAVAIVVVGGVSGVFPRNAINNGGAGGNRGVYRGWAVESTIRPRATLCYALRDPGADIFRKMEYCVTNNGWWHLASCAARDTHCNVTIGEGPRFRWGKLREIRE